MKTPLPQLGYGRVLADSVTASLREAIISGYFEPGEKIDQDLIAAELRVSRTPVREALKALEFEGFIEVRPHHGAFIAQVSRQDIGDIYEVRALLEAEIIRQVTPLIPESVLDELERSLDETQVEFDVGDVTKHFVSDVYFHETIASFVENGLLRETLESLTNRVSIVRRFAQSRPGPHLVESFKEHRAILQAIRQRNSTLAVELMRTHLMKSAIRIAQLAEQ